MKNFLAAFLGASASVAVLYVLFIKPIQTISPHKDRDGVFVLTLDEDEKEFFVSPGRLIQVRLRAYPPYRWRMDGGYSRIEGSSEPVRKKGQVPGDPEHDVFYFTINEHVPLEFHLIHPEMKSNAYGHRIFARCNFTLKPFKK